MRAPTPPADRRRPAAAVAVALLLALVTVGLGARAGAQTPGSSATSTAAPASTTAPVAPTEAPAGSVPDAETTSTLPPPPASDAPFPAPFVAPIPPVAGPPQLVAADLYVTQSEDPTSPDVVVRFKGPFTLPPGTYKVAVVVGDPLGARLRATLVSKDKVTSGEIDLDDANGRRALGPTTALFDPSGMVVVRVPLASAPAGDAVWVEITDNAGNVPDAVSPMFSRTVVFGGAEPGLLPSSQFGRVSAAAGPAGSGEPVAIPAGPVVSVVNEGIKLDYREPAPAELLGQPVTEVVDSLQIAPNFDNGAVVNDFVRLNRTDGTIGLYDGNAPTPVDLSGDRAWIGQGLPTPSTASGEVVLDLKAISGLLGFTPDPARTAFGVSRSFTLADGRIVTAGPTLATLGWFESAAPPPATVPTETAPSAASAGSDESRTALLVGAGAAALVVVLVVVGVAVRRRRSGDIDWIARAAAEEGATPGPEDAFEPEPAAGGVAADAGSSVAAAPVTAVAAGVAAATAGEEPGGPGPATAEQPVVPTQEPVVPTQEPGVVPVAPAPTGSASPVTASAEVVAGAPAPAEPEPTGPEPTGPAQPGPASTGPASGEHLVKESPVTGELQWADVVEPTPPAEPSDPLAALAALDDDLAALRSRLGLDPDEPSAQD